MGATGDGNTVRFCHFRCEVPDIQGIEAVAGDICLRTVRRLKQETLLLAGGIKRGIGIPCRSRIPPVHLHIRLFISFEEEKRNDPGINPGSGTEGGDR